MLENHSNNKDALLQLISPKTLTWEQLNLVVLNYSSNNARASFVCIFLGMTLMFWMPWWQCVLWSVIGILFTLWGGANIKAFLALGDKAQENIDKWKYKIILPRFAFVINWSSLVLFYWIPEHPETFALTYLLVVGTLSQNAATSGAYIKMMYFEIMPKVIITLGVTVYLWLNAPSDTGYYYLVMFMITIITTLFVIRLGKDIESVALLQLLQKYQLRQAIEKAESASQAKSVFLAVMGHEVRTPLSGILGVTHLLKNTSDEQKKHEYIRTISTSGENLLLMLNNILDFSSLEGGHVELNHQGIHTKNFFQNIYDLMHPLALKKSLTLQFDISDNMPNHFISDPSRLQQVLVNLIGNALKFTNKGTVTVSIQPELEGQGKREKKINLYFSVIDTGVGIESNVKESLFEKFTQSDRSRAAHQEGIGLGLAISKEIITAMNGEIDFESEKNKGTKFWFKIPVTALSKEAYEAMHKEETAIPHLSPLSILLAEDHEINQQVMSDILKQYGHNVKIANNGREAVEMVNNNDFDLILMDLEMPIMDGDEAIKTIRSIENNEEKVPIIALSAFSADSNRAQQIIEGATAYLEKPINVVLLFRTIAKHLPKKVIKELSFDKSKSHHPSTPMSVPVPNLEEQIDLMYLEDIKQIKGESYVKSLIADRLPIIREMILEISDGTQMKDSNALFHQAHKLYSLTSMFGLKSCSQITENIQKICENNDYDKAFMLAQTLLYHYERNAKAIKKHYITPSSEEHEEMK